MTLTGAPCCAPLQSFIKLVNYNHLMPTRYSLDLDLKSGLGQLRNMGGNQSDPGFARIRLLGYTNDHGLRTPSH